MVFSVFLCFLLFFFGFRLFFRWISGSVFLLAVSLDSAVTVRNRPKHCFLFFCFVFCFVFLGFGGPGGGFGAPGGGFGGFLLSSRSSGFATTFTTNLKATRTTTRTTKNQKNKTKKKTK